jgi:hypothetical protein
VTRYQLPCLAWTIISVPRGYAPITGAVALGSDRILKLDASTTATGRTGDAGGSSRGSPAVAPMPFWRGSGIESGVESAELGGVAGRIQGASSERSPRTALPKKPIASNPIIVQPVRRAQSFSRRVTFQAIVALHCKGQAQFYQPAEGEGAGIAGRIEELWGKSAREARVNRSGIVGGSHS